MAITSLRQFFAPNLVAADTSVTSFTLDTEVYATPNDLPATNNVTGRRAFVESNRGLYVWSGTGWYNLALITSDLALTQAANVSYSATTGSSPFYVNLAATSSNPVTWNYAVASGSLGSTTVNQATNTFLITPSSDAASFTLNFTASDGNNYVGATSLFSIIPPPGPNNIWSMGGSYSSSDRINIANDMITTTVRGSFPSTGGYASAGNIDFGWLIIDTRVERIDYINDMNLSSTRGPMNISIGTAGGAGNNNYGWFGSAYVGGTRSIIERIQYTNDLAASSTRGPLSYARHDTSAIGNDNYGWFGGGYYTGFPGFALGPSSSRSTIDRIQYSNDTTTSSNRGQLTAAIQRFSGTGNADYGWWMAGYVSGLISTVHRTTYSSDTGTAAVRGPLAVSRWDHSSKGDSNYGWVIGGGGPSTTVSMIQRVDYADDTSTASIRGPLTRNNRSAAATGGYPG